MLLMAGPWLYCLSEGKGNFELDDGPVPVTISNYEMLVRNKRLQEDDEWFIRESGGKIKEADDLFLYFGEKDIGIVGYAKIESVRKIEQSNDLSSKGRWTVKLQFDFDKCSQLLDHPIPAPVVRKWNKRLRPNLVPLNACKAALYSLVPWNASPLIPEEVPASSYSSQGHRESVQVNRYERDPKARSKCIEDRGTICVVCKRRRALGVMAAKSTKRYREFLPRIGTEETRMTIYYYYP